MVAALVGITVNSTSESPLLLATTTLLGVTSLLLINRPGAASNSARRPEAMVASPGPNRTPPESGEVAARLTTLWDQSPLCLMLLDPHSQDVPVKIVNCNQTALEWHGYTRAELIGKSIDLIEATPWTHDHREEWIEIITEKRKLEGEAFHRRKDGSLFPIEYFTALVQVDGRELVLGMDRNATALKAAQSTALKAKEEAEAANRAKSEFLAVMSHEIRTPMNGIMGFASLLEQTPLNEEQRDWVATINSSGETLLTLINDILDFSRIESGKLEIDRRPMNLVRECESTLELLWSRAEDRHVELVSWIDPNLPEWVSTDRARFRQVVTNLVSNAIKFTADGEVEVRIEPARATEEPSTLRISVRDTGIGIPPDRVDRLFKPFSQADSSTTRRFGGSGLGLVISRRLANLLGGNVVLENSSDQGSLFVFTCRADACDRPADAAPAAPLKDAHANLSGKTALVVDDNATNCRVLESLLTHWGLEVQTFLEPAALLDSLRVSPRPEIVLLDMMMPAMNGIDLAKALRRIDTLAQTPLILLSSVGREEISQFPETELFTSILTKPLRQSSLLETINEALSTIPQKITNPVIAVEPHQNHDAFARQFPMRILVAEDNGPNQKVIEQMLRRLGYSITITNDGNQCLEALRKSSYDLILMDCEMPKLDGFGATRAIRSGQAGDRNRGVRIVALTAAAMVGDKEKCTAAGMDDYATKPIKFATLETVLRRAASARPG